jgi:4-hydroxy-3-polyprenylbenzoate decarboxylase
MERPWCKPGPLWFSANAGGAPVESNFAERTYPEGLGGSQILIDATLKFPYPPVSLPSRELMEGARVIWGELGLPKLAPRVPWFGYPLGYWPESWDKATKLTSAGRYLESGKALGTMRTKSPRCARQWAA